MDCFKTDGRNAYATCVRTHAANITGQLRQVTLGSVGSTQAFGSTRMPAFFYRRNLIRMIMTIEMIAIQILIGPHLLSRPSRDLGYDQ